MAIRVSVVVICKKEAALDETLEVLARECGEAGGECIVVDASEGSLDWIRDKHPWVEWIEYAPNISGASSIPEQRNIGVAHANAPIIAFCDAGGIPETGWLQNIIDPIENERWQYGCGPVRSTRPGVYRTINDVEEGEVVASPPTANVAFTKKLFDQVGGFDERYAYGSDVDFAWRCAEAGEAPHCSKNAVMGMDWGPWTLQKRRSWRYGRARARLCRIHRGAWRTILKQQPEIIAYPGLQAFTVIGMLSGLVAPIAALFGISGFSVAVLLLRWRNRGSERPWAVMLGHVIYGWAFWYEIGFGPRWRNQEKYDVVHSPIDEGGPYVESLTQGLAGLGIRSRVGMQVSNSALLNLMAAPLTPIWWRMRGARIWHIHWTWGHVLPYAQVTFVRRVERWWFGLHLAVAKKCRMRIVWTAHNLYPHAPVFDDDRAARRKLVAAADVVIVHDEGAREKIAREFAPKKIETIEQGAIDLPTIERDTARAERGMRPDTINILGFGAIAAYKGYKTLLEAYSNLPKETAERTKIRIIGPCRDKDLLDELRKLRDRIDPQGENIVIETRYLSEEELAAEIAAADICAFLFEASLNSSTRKTAARAGKLAIVRGGGEPGLGEWLVEDAQGAARAIEILANLDQSERHKRESQARESMQRSWAECAGEVAQTYRRVLQ
jgi:glycosyltransferase involved in cell wall biosynthesis